MPKVFSVNSKWVWHMSKTAPSRRYMSGNVSFEGNKVPQLAHLPKEHTTVEIFREQLFGSKKPTVFGNDHGSPAPLLPALDKWFSKDLRNASTTLSEYFCQFRDAMVPYEIYAPTPAQKESLALFRDYLEKEQTQDKIITRSWDSCFTGPADGQDFFQLHAPLHLFTELSGTKVVRLMAPRAGDWLFRQIQAELQRSGNSRIRTDEMMQGEERYKLHQAVWEAGPDSPVPPGTYEVVLNPGDAMFIPTHYWHSVKSVGESGDLNASVNWWFR
ncbi:unnamed protein product [Fusarium graminearum]|nr:unnamed protein product [Fusarium graminearum]